jgi:hypothetical protein
MIRKEFLKVGLAAVALISTTGCSSIVSEGDREGDFSPTQLANAEKALAAFAKSRACSEFILVSRQHEDYATHPEKRLQTWQVNFCGTMLELGVLADGTTQCRKNLETCNSTVHLIEFSPKR